MALIGDTLYVCGGQGYSDPSDTTKLTELNDMYKLDIHTLKWTKLMENRFPPTKKKQKNNNKEEETKEKEKRDNKPKPMADHVMIAVNHMIFIYGGFYSEDYPHSDLYAYNTGIYFLHFTFFKFFFSS